MDRLNRPISARSVCQVLAALAWSCCIIWLIVTLTALRQESWNLGRQYGDYTAWLAFYVAIGIFSLLGFMAVRKIPAEPESILRRVWSFYRHGVVGPEGIFSGIEPGDTLGRLRVARQFFRLESRITSAPPRHSMVHCPMCQEILIGYPTDRVRCPNCSQRITYLQLAMDFDGIGSETMFAGGPAFGWMPGRVGKYLKTRYANFWR